jgi:coatomer protein complex subunit gamma
MTKTEPAPVVKVERKEINTSAIVHKSRAFRDVTLDLKKCRLAMISILQALAQDASFSERERTELFFSLTQLFHSKDRYIHRLLLLLLKQVPVNSHDSIIITHSLSKDISSSQEEPQGHAIRTLCAILEPPNVLSQERFLKLSIVSPVAYTASSVLCGCLRLIEGDKKDAVLRWIPEIRTASKSSVRSVRYHALRLLFALKGDDPYASAQLAASLEQPMSQLEQCVAIAITSQALKAKSSDRELEFMNRCLISGSPIVRLETARRATPEMLKITVDILSALMSGTTLKAFAAVRTVAESTDIRAYSSLLPKLQDLMKHSNASLAATAAICVLRLGNESHVEVAAKRILRNCRKWAGPLLRSVADEACRFAGRFRSEKLTDVVVFLLRVARDNFKFSILRALLTTDGIPRGQLLPRLSEYLEDYDSMPIARIICDFISGEVAQLDDPDALVPVLFNRVNLDVSSVRMAAVNTLAAIAVGCAGMKEKIVPLLELFSADEDDSVREEVLLFLNALTSGADISGVFTPFALEAREPARPAAAAAAKPAEAERVKVGQFVPAAMLDEFRDFGPLQLKTDAVDLTDADSEFVVSYFVNVFAERIVFEFLCTNTVEAISLTNVSVALEGIEVVQSIPAPVIRYQQTASMYCVVWRDRPMMFGRFSATLWYSQDDSETQEEWDLNAVVLNTKTWVRRQRIDRFDDAWEQLLSSDFAVLPVPKVKSATAAIPRIEEILGLEKVSEEKERRKVTVKLSGRASDDSWILVIAQIGTSNKTVVCRIGVASSSAELSEEILQSIAF